MTDLDLSVEIKDANGVATRWGPDEPDPRDIPTAISFGTRLMHGFADCSLTLARRIDSDDFDLSLLDELTVVGGDGSIAYEGRVGNIPRTFDTAHSISLQAAGWMAHAKDRRFTEIYIDRDLRRWGPMSQGRRATVLGVPALPVDPALSFDTTTNLSALHLAIERPTARCLGITTYDAGPTCKVASVIYSVTRTNMAAAPHEIFIFSGATDTTFGSSSANLIGAGTASGTYTIATPVRFAHLQTDCNSAVDALVHDAAWQLAVIGDHGLTLQGTGAEQGVTASDVIRNLISRFCPMLTAGLIADTTYPLPHLVFHDRTFPFDGFLDVNKYHLWNLACWENKTVEYGPLDYTDYDWEIRTDTEGTIIGLQGDSSEALANGIVVQYTNVATGAVDTLTPEVYPELADATLTNPYNQHGYPGQTDYTISFPTTLAAALQIGRVALAEFNSPKAPGTITKTHYIRDRAGHMQPVWKVRAGDRVAITSSATLSDRPRIIAETTYSHDSRSLTMSIEGPMPRQDAINDRVLTALAAANLT